MNFFQWNKNLKLIKKNRLKTRIKLPFIVKKSYRVNFTMLHIRLISIVSRTFRSIRVAHAGSRRIYSDSTGIGLISQPRTRNLSGCPSFCLYRENLFDALRTSFRITSLSKSKDNNKVSGRSWFWKIGIVNWIHRSLTSLVLVTRIAILRPSDKYTQV